MTTTAATNGRYRFSHVARMEWIKQIGRAHV